MNLHLRRDKFLILILIVTLVPVAMIFFDLYKCFEFWDLIKRFRLAELCRPVIAANSIGLSGLFGLMAHFKFLVPRRIDHSQSTKPSALPDLRVLNCRVELTKQKQRDSVSDTFSVGICGSVCAPTDMHYVTLRISIMDVTAEVHRPKPVQQADQGKAPDWIKPAFGRLDPIEPDFVGQVKQWSVLDRRVPGGSAFCHMTDLGKLPNKITILSDWTKVAQLNTDWLIFPRKGKRNLQFITSVLSRDDGQELACAKCNFAYRKAKPGYIDLEEDIQRTKTLAVALAFAVGAADQKLYDCEIELIKKWARSNFDYVQASDEARCKFDTALDEIVAFFRDGNQLNTYAICKQIAKIAPPAFRYDILDLCLHVAQANGSVAAEELAILKDLASWLEVDMNRFRAMMEKTLPVSMHQVNDVEVMLGVTAEMEKEKTRRQLNKEYGKWNSRTTSSDPKIRAQADQMLKLIAEARCQYIG